MYSKTTTHFEITRFCYLGHKPSYVKETSKTDLGMVAVERVQVSSYYQNLHKMGFTVTVDGNPPQAAQVSCILLSERQ
jgi:hypothetical protein